MTAKEKRTIEDALKQFKLINGAGSEESKKACAMTLLAWVQGRDWTDHPPCAHPRLADVVIRANDSDTATTATRASLVKAGQDGVLDTWWLPRIVVAWAMSRPKDDTKVLSPHQYAMYVLKRVAKWKASKGLPSDLLADLRLADLRSADLSSADLRSADLRSADLSSADLRSADLRSADLSSADLSSANLRSANLRLADLSSADLSSADLSLADLSLADLSLADLRSANLRLADLRSANLRSANLRSANLSSANLRLADLRSANLRSANLRSANLRSANLSSADLSLADLTGAYGEPYGAMPKGWKLNESGLWVKA